MGGDPIYGTHPGDFSPKCGLKADGDGTTDTVGLDMGISPSERCSAGVGVGDNGDVHLQTPE